MFRFTIRYAISETTGHRVENFKTFAEAHARFNELFKLPAAYVYLNHVDGRPIDPQDVWTGKVS